MTDACGENKEAIIQSHPWVWKEKEEKEYEHDEIKRQEDIRERLET